MALDEADAADLLRKTADCAKRLLERLDAERLDLSAGRHRLDSQIAHEGLGAIERVVAPAQELLRQASEERS